MRVHARAARRARQGKTARSYLGAPHPREPCAHTANPSPKPIPNPSDPPTVASPTTHPPDRQPHATHRWCACLCGGKVLFPFAGILIGSCIWIALFDFVVSRLRGSEIAVVVSRFRLGDRLLGVSRFRLRDCLFGFSIQAHRPPVCGVPQGVELDPGADACAELDPGAAAASRATIALNSAAVKLSAGARRHGS